MKQNGFKISDLRFPIVIQRMRPASTIPSAPGNRQSAIFLYLSSIAILFITASTGHAEETPRSAMRKGLKAYNAGDYTNAVTLLEKTVLEFPGTGNYNMGNAYYRMGEYEKAAECYEEALRTTDLKLQANACFNRGNALLAQTTVMTEPEQIGQAIECAFQAMAMFEQSLLLHPEDLQAKQKL